MHNCWGFRFVSCSKRCEFKILKKAKRARGVIFEYPFLMAPTQIDPNSRACSFEIGRASIAGSLTSKSENQQFFNPCLNNPAFITVLGKSPYSSTEFLPRMISSSFRNNKTISQSNFRSKRKHHCIFKTYSKLIRAQNILVIWKAYSSSLVF